MGASIRERNMTTDERSETQPHGTDGPIGHTKNQSTREDPIQWLASTPKHCAQTMDPRSSIMFHGLGNC